MKIIDAKQADGKILVECDITTKIIKLSFPLETSQEDIKAKIQSLEDTELKRVETMEANKERDEKKAKAEITIKSLTK